MILDYQNLFSNDQALTTTAASTNVIDLGADDAYIQDANEKGDVKLWAQVTTALAGGTSVQAVLQEDDDVAFGTAVTLVQSAAIAAASLVAGYQFPIEMPSRISKRYLRINYVIVGTFTSGAVSAGLVLEKQTANVK